MIPVTVFAFFMNTQFSFIFIFEYCFIGDNGAADIIEHWGVFVLLCHVLRTP